MRTVLRDLVHSRSRGLNPVFLAEPGVSPVQWPAVSPLPGRGWLALVACSGAGGFAV